MFFKKRDDDLKDIKDAIEGVEALPTHQYDEYLEEKPSPAREMSAPLFVKVEKYRDILQSVNEMKLFVSSTKQLFSVMQELEEIRNDSLKIMRATVLRLEKTLSDVDTDLLRPRGLTMDISPGDDMIHIEESLTELQRQIMNMKRELQEMK